LAQPGNPALYRDLYRIFPGDRERGPCRCSGKKENTLLAPGPVAAAGTCNFTGLTGGAATGIAEFQVRCAGIPVAGGTRNFLMLLAAGAGVKVGGFGLVVGF